MVTILPWPLRRWLLGDYSTRWLRVNIYRNQRRFDEAVGWSFAPPVSRRKNDPRTSGLEEGLREVYQNRERKAKCRISPSHRQRLYAMIMGTIPAFKERIEACFNLHKDELMQNPQFMGLFQAATARGQ